MGGGVVPGTGGGGAHPPRGESKSQQLHVLRARLEDKWEQQKPASRLSWSGDGGPDTDPHPWQHPQQKGLCQRVCVLGQRRGPLGGLNKWAGGKGCSENRGGLSGQQAPPQGLQSRAEPTLWLGETPLWEGREGLTAKVSAPPFSLGSRTGGAQGREDRAGRQLPGGWVGLSAGPPRPPGSSS